MSTQITLNAEISERRDISKSLFIFRILFLDGSHLNFEPGQYAELALPEVCAPGSEKILRRQYSIASAPGDPRGIELFISTVEDGLFTPQLSSLNCGDKLWMGPKAKGKFTLDGLSSERLVLIATGTGVAPYISMLRSLSQSGDCGWDSIVLLSGVRILNDLAYEAELEALSKLLPLTYLPTLSRASDDQLTDWAGLRGRVTDCMSSEEFAHITGKDFNPESDTVLLCGNPQMVADACELLGEKGLTVYKRKTGGQIHFERYW